MIRDLYAWNSVHLYVFQSGIDSDLKTCLRVHDECFVASGFSVEEQSLQFTLPFTQIGFICKCIYSCFVTFLFYPSLEFCTAWEKSESWRFKDRILKTRVSQRRERRMNVTARKSISLSMIPELRGYFFHSCLKRLCPSSLYSLLPKIIISVISSFLKIVCWRKEEWYTEGRVKGHDSRKREDGHEFIIICKEKWCGSKRGQNRDLLGTRDALLFSHFLKSRFLFVFERSLLFFYQVILNP